MEVESWEKAEICEITVNVCTLQYLRVGLKLQMGTLFYCLVSTEVHEKRDRPQDAFD